jgi:hypothetical protein
MSTTITTRKAYLMENGQVLCEACYEEAQLDRTRDHDPGAWLESVEPWSPSCKCASCGPSRPRMKLVLPLYTTPEQRANHVIQATELLNRIKAARAEGCALPQLP